MSGQRRNLWPRSRAEQPGRFTKVRRAVLAAGGIAVVGSAGAGVVMALPAAHAATRNHIYVHRHGLPTCTITFEWFDLQNTSVKKDHGTASPCGGEASWSPDNVSLVRVRVNSGTEIFEGKYASSATSSHDHCILVKAFGSIVETGDETQGCNSK